MLTPMLKSHMVKLEYLKKQIAKATKETSLPKQYTILLLAHELTCVGEAAIVPSCVENKGDEATLAFIEQYDQINPQSQMYCEAQAVHVLTLILDYAKAVVEWNRVAVPAANKLDNLYTKASNVLERETIAEEKSRTDLLLENEPLMPQPPTKDDDIPF